MATLSLKISIVGQNVVKTMQFEPTTIVYDACRIIRERFPEANPGNRECPADIARPVNLYDLGVFCVPKFSAAYENMR